MVLETRLSPQEHRTVMKREDWQVQIDLLQIVGTLCSSLSIKQRFCRSFPRAQVVHGEALTNILCGWVVHGDCNVSMDSGVSLLLVWPVMSKRLRRRTARRLLSVLNGDAPERNKAASAYALQYCAWAPVVERLAEIASSSMYGPELREIASEADPYDDQPQTDHAQYRLRSCLVSLFLGDSRIELLRQEQAAVRLVNRRALVGLWMGWIGEGSRRLAGVAERGLKAAWPLLGQAEAQLIRREARRLLLLSTTPEYRRTICARILAMPPRSRG